MTIDSAILQGAFKGDRKAQYVLFKDCFPVLMAVCMRYRRDQQEAQASLNQGFLKIIQHLDRYRQNEVPFDAWIRRIMINSLIDEYRREKKWRDMTVYTEQVEQEGADEPVDFNDADQRLRVEHIEALIRQLPPATRQVFNLFAIDGFSHKEISESLGMSEGTSKWHVNQARQQLQIWMKTELKPANGV
jgi:RNA polymerase sigma factor (sigma-70 family)